jgi:hypothetical protein
LATVIRARVAPKLILIPAGQLLPFGILDKFHAIPKGEYNAALLAVLLA